MGLGLGFGTITYFDIVTSVFGTHSGVDIVLIYEFGTQICFNIVPIFVFGTLTYFDIVTVLSSEPNNFLI